MEVLGGGVCDAVPGPGDTRSGHTGLFPEDPEAGAFLGAVDEPRGGDRTLGRCGIPGVGRELDAGTMELYFFTL